jgi:hypothetical protein
MTTRCIPTWLSIAASVIFWTGAVTGAEPNNPLAFRPGDKGGYAFDTGVLRGVLRQDGKSRGLSSVVHIPSGLRLDGSVGIAGHYRVFTTNRRYGTAAWDWPSTAELQADGSVRTTWLAAEDRPFEMTALYRWADPQTLDVETTVTAREDLSGFESFFASYFNEAFPSPHVSVNSQGDEVRHEEFLPGKKDLGDWLMFTFEGDGRGDRLARDGRWLLEPHPVNWTILPRLSTPLCVRRGKDHALTVMLMAPREECFAAATPYEGEAHYSLYLSLFGRNFKVGESAKAHTRFVVAKDISDADARRLYGQYADLFQHAR